MNTVFPLVLLGLFFFALFALIWLVPFLREDGAPDWGGPRKHRIIYRSGESTVLLTPREAYGLWHVFKDDAVEWWEGNRLRDRRRL